MRFEISTEDGTVPWSIKMDGEEVADQVRSMQVNIGDRGEMTTVTLEFYADGRRGSGDGLVLELGAADVVVVEGNPAMEETYDGRSD